MTSIPEMDLKLAEMERTQATRSRLPWSRFQRWICKILIALPLLFASRVAWFPIPEMDFNADEMLTPVELSPKQI